MRQNTRAPGAARGDLLQLGLAVEGEQAHAQGEGPGDVGLLLDRVAIGDPVGRRAGGQRHLDLGRARDIERGAHAASRDRISGAGLALTA